MFKNFISKALKLLASVAIMSIYLNPSAIAKNKVWVNDMEDEATEDLGKRRLVKKIYWGNGNLKKEIHYKNGKLVYQGHFVDGNEVIE
tara:strand:+ start:1947 stop:2210 length:264 start_codon:yes stop_codon:yes gene_type:complete